MQIAGKAPIYEWINDNGPVDLVRKGIEIQQKFVNSGNHLSLQAVRGHLQAYPDFLLNGGKYQIPEDHYAKIKYLLSIPEEQANKMPTSTGEFSLKQWKEVHDFFDKGDIKLKDLEPSVHSYKDVQRDVIKETLDKEKVSLRKTDSELRHQVHEKHQPTFQEGMKAAGASAVIEGGFTLSAGIIKKIRSGKSIKDFTEEDWKEILKESGTGVIKGGIRGASIYVLTNKLATPAAIANALVTASFGIAQQAYLLKNGRINTKEFFLNSEALCVDVSVSALSSFIGQTFIPIPVLGAVIGNSVGMMIYQTGKDVIKRKDRQILESYFKEIKDLEKKLDHEYRVYVQKLNVELDRFYNLLENAFAIDCNDALNGSIALAEYVGVPSGEILRSIADADNYFLN